MKIHVKMKLLKKKEEKKGIRRNIYCKATIFSELLFLASYLI